MVVKYSVYEVSLFVFEKIIVLRYARGLAVLYQAKKTSSSKLHKQYNPNIGQSKFCKCQEPYCDLCFKQINQYIRSCFCYNYTIAIVKIKICFDVEHKELHPLFEKKKNRRMNHSIDYNNLISDSLKYRSNYALALSHIGYIITQDLCGGNDKK